jgi:hypothetical protein
MNITLNLTIENANIILNALADQPFKLVADLISDIQRQATTQVQPESPQPTIE